MTAAHVNRIALIRRLKAVESADTLIVWKLDWLGCRLRGPVPILYDCKRQGIKFRSLTETIDPETPTGRVVCQMIGVFSDLERSAIVSIGGAAYLQLLSRCSR